MPVAQGRRVEKPWGRANLPAPFGDPSDRDRSIGEIIFDGDGNESSELLVKFLFTTEKLSIQVHPDDRLARSQGLPRGKDEAWIVFDAESGATIGLGLKETVSKPVLRQAALDGSIEALVDWRAAKPGDAYYSPAGAIHAIGPGLSLVEIQQNIDVTYRLYDYGRPRELHLDQAIDAVKPELQIERQIPTVLAPEHLRLAGGPAFQVEQLSGPASGRLSPHEKEAWLVALAGEGRIGGADIRAGQVWRLDQPAYLRLEREALFILAYPGAEAATVWGPDEG